MNIAGFLWEGWKIWLQLLCRPADWQLNTQGNCKHERHLHSACTELPSSVRERNMPLDSVTALWLHYCWLPRTRSSKAYLRGAELREMSLLHLHNTKASHCTDGLQSPHFSTYMCMHQPSVPVPQPSCLTDLCVLAKALDVSGRTQILFS